MGPRLVADAAGRGPAINGFAEGGFRIDGVVYRTGALLTPQGASAWNAPAIADLRAEDLLPLLALEPAPEFILIGTGPMMERPARALVQAIEARGIGVEAMDSRAAARAWGVLRAEERWIAAALLPLER